MVSGFPFFDLEDLIMADAKIPILCGCGWGDLAFEISEGEIPVCPVCNYEFPQFDTDEYFDYDEDDPDCWERSGAVRLVE